MNETEKDELNGPTWFVMARIVAYVLGLVAFVPPLWKVDFSWMTMFAAVCFFACLVGDVAVLWKRFGRPRSLEA